MHGQVVQAIQGQREHYQPIQSALTPSHHLVDVVAAILQVYPFNSVYIADLNAIMHDARLPHHQQLIYQAKQAFPQLEWWVDAGVSAPADLQSWLDLGVRPIIGSEQLTDLTTYHQLNELSSCNILSLDFFKDGFKGPHDLLANPQFWTNPSILMSLPNVGAHTGPNIDLLKHMQHQQPNHSFYAAGGIRNMADIEQLHQLEAAGVLIASALHRRTVNGEQLRQFTEKNMP